MYLFSLNFTKLQGVLYIFYAFLLMSIILPLNELQAQFQVRDVYGNKLPTPSWPPPDSLFEDNKFIVWFNRDVTDKQFINDNWSYYYNPPTAIGGDNNSIQTYFSIPGCYDVDLSFLHYLLKDTNLINLLYNLDLEQFCQVSNFMPIQDSLSYTRNGDTILTPEFWNCYEVTLSEESPYTPVQCVQFLNYFYGGNQISYAELSPKMELFDCDFNNLNPPNPTNDPRWTQATSFYNDSPLEKKFYYQNILRAWSLTPALRGVKVGVVDTGINEDEDDFDSRVIDGYDAQTEGHASGDSKFPSRHGTAVAGLIGNKNNNVKHSLGVAGGCGENDGVSLYSLKVPFSNFSIRNITKAWLHGVKSENNPEPGFGVYAVNLSLGWDNDYENIFNETLRRALDYSYRMGVVSVIATGNINKNVSYPANYEYNKLIAVGSYSAYKRKNFNNEFVASKFTNRTTDGGSNFGKAVDLLSMGGTLTSYETIPRLLNGELSDLSNSNSNFGGTSAAAPQVTGTVALMMSKIIEDEPANIDLPLVPEDYEGLLNISAFDCKYHFIDYDNNDFIDTIGYDERTGYGILKADTCLMYLENPYILRHFTSNCEDCIDELVEAKQEFIILRSEYFREDDFGLLPTSKEIQYVADRYRVSKTISVGDLDIDEGLLEARIWGLGGKEPGTDNKTIGWNGVQPKSIYVDEAGYCRVVGDSDENDPNFNHNNLKDIAYRNDLSLNDVFTIETFVYEVYSATISLNGDVIIGNSLGYYPCEPDEVKYRFTVWGELPVKLDVGKEINKSTYDNIISVRCETLGLLNNNILSVYYSMKKFEPVEISVYDLKGNKLLTERKHTWNNQSEQKVYLELNNLNSGIYLIEVKSNSSYGSTKFTFSK